MNITLSHEAAAVGPAASRLHSKLVVGDLHADSLLWRRNLLRHSSRGHVDIPRLQAGNVALQVFTAVTQSPAGLNYGQNARDSRDNITLLALAQAWPVATWTSRYQRALYQARRLHRFAERAPRDLQVITNRQQLRQLLQARQQGAALVGGILGTEGSHALDGELDNIRGLHEHGYRVMGLHHFFDNALGGSLHGESGQGLTAFGEQAVDQMRSLGIIIDVAHSSEQVVRDVLARDETPLLLSHSGFQGHCPSQRNISDELMQAIAAGGGLIGVGFWEAAVCDASPAGIAAAIRYGIALVGADHLALGSDFDGAVSVPFDSSELATLTQALLDAGISPQDIRKVMGGNLVRFFDAQLPAD
ncbi:peptidase M19 [Kineobactrum salinum]|uniref:Peptidase M19 n=2 Tax=Kineobactrum salinum TaxID=2708301 RepID=A0A6C0UA86_9GAMM|nr:peptidase M19 [Kineobactrum salinum]